jgi:hypothetical protein
MLWVYCVSQDDDGEVSPVNVTLFGKKVFMAGQVKVKWLG